MATVHVTLVTQPTSFSPTTMPPVAYYATLVDFDEPTVELQSQDVPYPVKTWSFLDVADGHYVVRAQMKNANDDLFGIIASHDFAVVSNPVVFEEPMEISVEIVG